MLCARAPNTPYQYAGNQPIIAIDLDGLEPLKPGSEGESGAQSTLPQTPNPAPLMSLEDIANPQPVAQGTDFQQIVHKTENSGVMKVRDLELKAAKVPFTAMGNPDNIQDAINLYAREGEALPIDDPGAGSVSTDQGGAMANLEKALEIQIQAGGDPNRVGKLQFEIRQYKYLSEGKDPAQLQPFQAWQQTDLDAGMSLLMIGKGMRGSGGSRAPSGGSGDDGLIRVRHHTGPKPGKNIIADQAIAPSRGRPYGVDVELPPFAKPKNAKFGQSESGAYIEFSVPAQKLSRIPGSMDDPTKVARIVTEGPSTPLDISNMQPQLKVWRRWWKF